jgi:hypothetical protein
VQSNKKLLSIIIAIPLVLSSWSAFALPLDIQGKFAARHNNISNFRKTRDTDVPTTSGSQITPTAAANYKDASFQDYNLRLMPSIIINDSASFFSEVTTAYNNGNHFGDSTKLKKEDGNSSSFGDALYLQNTTNQSSNLRLSQFYLKLFSDTATYTIGRHSNHWGLGALINDGRGDWDHYATIEDGVVAQLKLGNFQPSVYWSKINQGNSLTKAGDTASYGLTIKYENLEKDMVFGLMYGKRSTHTNNTFYKTGNGRTIARAEVKVVDLHIKKRFANFLIQLEAPLITGDVSGIYNDKTNKYKANAVIVESSYDFSDSVKASLNVGSISGEDGKPDVFHALFLNPNYQVANLMFRYNYAAISDANQNIYDSYMTNTQYLRAATNYENDLWKLELAYIYAVANEVAHKNQRAYNHSNNQYFDSQYEQQKDLGHEIDLNGDYKWNNNISFKANLGYHFVGNYYQFTNSDRNAKIKNVYGLSFGVASSF